MTRRIALLLFVLAIDGTVSAQSPTTHTPARAEDGHPDLQGVWNFDSGVPLQRPAAFAERKVLTKEEFDAQFAAGRAALRKVASFAPVEAVGLDLLQSTPRVEDLRTSLITYPDNGRLPALAPGARRNPGPADFVEALSDPKADLSKFAPLLATFGAGKKDSYSDFGLSDRCLGGMPVPMVPDLGDNYVQIVQSPGHVVLISDAGSRIISINGQHPTSDALRTWSGTSVGHWQGDTLVVETRHFLDRGESFAGAGKPRDKVVTERFTRTAGQRLQYAATIVDPRTFQDRIELSFPMARVDGFVYESACHEGNYSLRNALSGARKAEEEKRKTD